MGICSSCDATSVATAKLIQQDGRLEEFPYPVKVSYLLQKNPACFICNSDEMDFDDIVSAVDENDELQLGQLYFALPLSRLRKKLQAEDMAALAVKASSALMRSGGGKCGGRRKGVNPVSFCVEMKLNSDQRVDSSDGDRRRRKGGRRKNYTGGLGSIPE